MDESGTLDIFYMTDAALEEECLRMLKMKATKIVDDDSVVAIKEPYSDSD